MESCNKVRTQCTDKDLPTCRNVNVQKQREIDRLDTVVDNLESDVMRLEVMYETVKQQYDDLVTECTPKITQAYCDEQARDAHFLALYKNSDHMFNSKIVVH